VGFQLRVQDQLARRHPAGRVAARSGARAEGQMNVVGLTWDRWVWHLATGGEARLQPASAKQVKTGNSAQERPRKSSAN
jgi:hypothetical protein